jgi:hypothetical protein
MLARPIAGVEFKAFGADSLDTNSFGPDRLGAKLLYAIRLVFPQPAACLAKAQVYA